jgi:tyrosyl-tRNA synthetase
MPDYGLRAQVVLTNPLLEGTDARVDPATGKLTGNKMSKSLGNYVGIVEAPDEQFGKLMSVSDELMWRYYELLSERSAADIEQLKRGHPRAAKVALAKEIVARYHGLDAAARAEDHFHRLHVAREAPEEVQELQVTADGSGSVSLAAMLADSGLTPSRSEARRLIEQGGVTVAGARVADPRTTLGVGEHLIKVGKRRFVKLRIS